MNKEKNEISRAEQSNCMRYSALCVISFVLQRELVLEMERKVKWAMERELEREMEPEMEREL
ncbi:hypothetical protein PP707_07645 [Acetobacter pasteurianus]|nr:hypothetical protein [Acetobacter pasteurianus]